MANGDTIQQNPPASPIDNPPPPPIAPPSPKPMDENAVLQMIGGIKDKKQQIIQGVARGLNPMVSADNTDQQLVPPSRVAEAQQAGYQPATMMSNPDDPDGLYLVPHGQVQDAINNHWSVGQPVGQPAKGVGEVVRDWYASKLPQPVISGMQWFQREISDPAERSAQWMGQQIGQRSEKAAAAFSTPSPAPVPNPQAPTGYLGRMFSTQPKYLPITPQQQQEQLQTARQQHPVALGIAKGIGETAGQMMGDPRMWPLMFGGEALPVVQKLASAGFSAQMLYGAYETYPEIKAAADRGDEEGVANLLTHLGLSSYFAAKGALGTVGDLGDLGLNHPAVGNQIADYLNSKAEEQFQRVLLQGGGTKKQKVLAQKLAPEMAERGIAAWTSGQLERKSAAQMETTGKEIEQYYQGLPEGQTIPTKPILNYFEQAKQEFMAPDSGKVLDQNAIDKVDALKQVVQQFGPDVSVDDIVKLRRLWDEQVASSAPGHLLPADESTAVGIKREAADAIRGELAKQFPDLDKINKEYSFWKGVNDVMSATNLRTAGHAKFSLTDLFAGATPFGSLIHLGLGKATLGATTGLMLMRAMRSTAWETVSANIKSRIADYLADGNVAAASKLAAQAIPVGAQSSFTPLRPGLPPGQYEQPPSTLPPQGALPPGPEAPALPPATPPGTPQIPTGSIPLPESPLGANVGQQQYVPTPTAQEPPFAPSEVVPPRMLGPARLPASISGPREAAQAAEARGTNLPAWAALGQPRPEAAPQPTGTQAGAAPVVDQVVDKLFAGRQAEKQAHGKAVANMLLDADQPPESMDWNVVRPGRGLPNAIELNDAARQMIGHAINARFGGVSMSPNTLDTEVLPRLEMAAQAMDNTRAQRPDYFSPDASATVRDLINTIQQNRGPEGISFTRSEGTPEQQRYTTHEELFHTAVQRRPAAQAGGLAVPDMADDPGMEKMRPRIIDETGRLTSIVHHAEGMADIMQGRAPELTPEEAGSTAENYWTQLAQRGKSGVQALVDAFRLENFMDDHEKANGYTLDDATNAIRTAGRDALARVLSRQYGTDLRGLSRAVQSEAEPTNVAGAERGAVAAGAVPTGGGEANLRSPAEAAEGTGAGPEVAPTEEAPLFSDRDKRISVRKPTAGKSTEDPMKNDLQADTEAIRASGGADKIAEQIRKYPGMNLKGNTESVLQGFHDRAVENLLWLHDKFPQEWRDQARQWYDGANELSKNWGKANDRSPQQVAGVIASQSPQKDWHMNVGLADRIIDIDGRGDELQYTPEMKKKAPQLATAARNAALKKADKAEAKGNLDSAEKLRANADNFGKALKKIAGKDYSDLTLDSQKALWIRLYDEAHNPRSYDVYSPDGSVIGPAMTDKGNVKKIAWGSTPTIAKAVRILGDDSRQNISDQLGNQHKVRSFYNNIIAPNSKAGDVTIDTHAVAAANFRPLAGKDIEVKQNFGGGGAPNSAITGTKGNYGIYGDIYRDAAAQRGLNPREMQSITWEAIRSLFTPEFKRSGGKGIIDKIWKEHSNDPEAARNAIFEAAGGFTPPSWISGGRDLAGDEGAASSAESGVVPNVRLRAGSTGGAVGGAGSRAAGTVPEVGRVAPPIPPQLRRVMRK